MTYTPTTDEVETAFHEFASNLETEYPGTYEEAPEFSDWKQAMYGFRRWLAGEIRKAKAEALTEAADSVTEIDGRKDDKAAKWLRNRAQQLKEGQ